VLDIDIFQTFDQLFTAGRRQLHNATHQIQHRSRV